MDTATRHPADLLALFAALEAVPYRHDFYQTLRRIECACPDRPRWGEADRPSDEPVRLGQEPHLTFAPASLASFDAGGDGRPPRLQVYLFGLFGPNGPLPSHLTEYARERLRHAGDATLCRFADMLQHRFIALLYSAWARSQPHVNRDRPHEDRFAGYVGAFVGVAPRTLRERDSVPDEARLFHAGALARQVRNVDGLVSILQQFFRVAVRLEEHVGHWMVLDENDRTRLGRPGATLGRGAVAGGRVWDRQYKFRLHLGPLNLAQYESFLPGGLRLRQLVDWVRFYLCHELAWDVRLRLQRSHVPGCRLGGPIRLGWTTWLGSRHATTDAADLCLDAEALMIRPATRNA